jgi:hypothetical protein
VPLYVYRMKLLPKERKLLLLALDRAAHAGEVENAAVAFVRSMKTRFGDRHQLFRNLSNPHGPSTRAWTTGRQFCLSANTVTVRSRLFRPIISSGSSTTARTSTNAWKVTLKVAGAIGLPVSTAHSSV